MVTRESVNPPPLPSPLWALGSVNSCCLAGEPALLRQKHSRREIGERAAEIGHTGALTRGNKVYRGH